MKNATEVHSVKDLERKTYRYTEFKKKTKKTLHSKLTATESEKPTDTLDRKENTKKP